MTDFVLGYGNYTPVSTALTIDDFFMTLNPYTFAGLAIGLSLGVSTAGAAWGIALVGSALTGNAVYKPHVRTRNIVRYTSYSKSLVDILVLYFVKQ
jgi:hypothetical protein